jgi:hypothetical protein
MLILPAAWDDSIRERKCADVAPVATKMADKIRKFPKNATLVHSTRM